LFLDEAAYLAFRSCVTGQHAGKSGSESLTMDYHLIETSPAVEDRNITVCRECFAFTFDTTVAALKKYAKHYKANKDGIPVDLKARKFNDSTIPPYTWSEMETIYARNLGEYHPGFLFMRHNMCSHNFIQLKFLN